MFRRVIALGLILALCLIVAPRAVEGASAVRFDLLASATQTATGQGGAIPVIGITEMTVYVACTAESSGTQLDVYLQSSSDGGTTWYDIIADTATELDATATEATTNTNKRDILDAETDCTSAKYSIGRYTVFGDLVRVAWVLSGTSFTFSVKAIGK